jgi:hypothetical protein
LHRAIDEFPSNLPEKEKSVFCHVLAGSIAGELFEYGDVGAVNKDQSTGDNAILSRLTDKPLTDFQPAASAIIDRNRRVFRQLCSKLGARYRQLRYHILESGIGEFILVSEEELDALLIKLE